MPVFSQIIEYLKKVFYREPTDIKSLSHIEFGRWAEKTAERFLKKKGMKLLARNYRCKFGEIDLIMLDDDFIVFVEVKATRSFGLDPVTHIDRAKKRRIVRMAKHFIAINRLEECPARFDVVSVVALISDNRSYDVQIEHEENYFTVRG